MKTSDIMIFHRLLARLVKQGISREVHERFKALFKFLL